MKRCIKLNNLSDIKDLYDVFLIDLWGVIHNGIAVFENVIPVLENLKQKNKMVFCPLWSRGIPLSPDTLHKRNIAKLISMFFFISHDDILMRLNSKNGSKKYNHKKLKRT